MSNYILNLLYNNGGELFDMTQEAMLQFFRDETLRSVRYYVINQTISHITNACRIQDKLLCMKNTCWLQDRLFHTQRIQEKLSCIMNYFSCIMNAFWTHTDYFVYNIHLSD